MLITFELPLCFTKQEFISQSHRGLETINSRIRRALKRNEFLQLKNGLYMTSAAYLHEPDKASLAELIASQLRQPSYISLEYVLEKHLMLVPSARVLTSITAKKSCVYENFSGKYSYSNMKASLHFGLEERVFHGHTYRIATKAKALFDYLYLHPLFGKRNEKYLRYQLFEKSEIQWANFSEHDYKEFDQYVWTSNSFKMMRILRVIHHYFEGQSRLTY